MAPLRHQSVIAAALYRGLIQIGESVFLKYTLPLGMPGVTAHTSIPEHTNERSTP